MIKFLIPLFALSQYSHAGPFASAAGQPGSTAITATDSAFVAWATGYQNHVIGDGVSATWQDPTKALGVAGDSGNTGTPNYSGDIVSLGRGGEITLTLANPITDGEGYDFAVFENSFSDTFLELAWVEVSSNGTDFFRFTNYSLTPSPVAGFGSIDPTNIEGYAGKYRGGFGTPFDLNDLAGIEGLDILTIQFIKLIDITGDGTEFDDFPVEGGGPNPIYDPYPTSNSAGFDLDAVGVINQVPVSPVPLPAGIWLFTSALGLLVQRKLRH